MPRYPGQGLDSLASKASQESLVSASLSESPLRIRSLSHSNRLTGFGARLAAAESWVARLDASTQTRLMVAASARPPEIASVFDYLEAACNAAAPITANSDPQESALGWLQPAASNRSEVQRLMHLLGLLGDYVTGSWRMVPSGIGVDGTRDDDELTVDYSPPSEALGAIIATRALVATEASLYPAFADDADRLHTKMRRLAGSASGDLHARLTGTDATIPMSRIEQHLRAHHRPLLDTHRRFITAVNEVRRAMTEHDERAPYWWQRAQHELAATYSEWAEHVLAVVEMTSTARQAYRRDLKGWMGYMMQYVVLLQGNASAYELIRMLTYLRAICEKLQHRLHRLIPVAGDDQARRLAKAVRRDLDRVLVSPDLERQWRIALGDRAKGVGQLIDGIVGKRGQTKALTRMELLDMPACRDLISANTERASADALDSLLVQMQSQGLAAKIPARLFRRIDAHTPRTGVRRRIHVARDWWFNPLGTVLVERRR